MRYNLKDQYNQRGKQHRNTVNLGLRAGFKPSHGRHRAGFKPSHGRHQSRIQTLARKMQLKVDQIYQTKFNFSHF